MAKKSKAASATIGIDMVLLKAIADATAANTNIYVSQAQGEPMLKHVPPLIDVNMGLVDPADNSRVAARVRPEGVALLNKPADEVKEDVAPMFGIITNAVLPPSKRGNKGGGAPTIYPFEKLEIGQSFFVPKSEKHKDPVKTLGSTVSAANMRFAEKTDQTKSVERTKRGQGNKAILNPDGTKQKETVDVPVYKLTRKFSLRSVKANEKYGDWVAPADGALIARVPIE